MKINITYENSLRVIDSPPRVNCVGVTAVYKKNRIEVMNFCRDDICKQDEEIILDENSKIIIHYYSAPIFAELLEMYSGFEGIGCIEIENKGFHLSVCV